MKKINLETDPRFKEMMTNIGFKKSSHSFIRKYKDMTLEMMFGYATNGEKHVRYYSGSYFIRYPQIETFANKLGFTTFPLGGLMGYLMPQKSGLVEWRLAESDTESYYLDMLEEIKNAITGYLLPFAEKNLTIIDFVYGAEMGYFRNGQYDYRAVAIAYYLLGESDNCLSYMNNILKFFANQSKNGTDEDFQKSIGAIEDVQDISYNRNYINYKLFSDKMKDWIKNERQIPE